jgi:signal transduction histidine kinase
MTVQEHVVGDSPTAAHFRVLDWAMSDAFNSESLDVALKFMAEYARVLIGAHQAALSYIPGGDFTAAVHQVSLSDKYEKYRTYDVVPTGDGIWSLVLETRTGVIMTQEEILRHPRWRNFSGAKDARGTEHPPMRGWLAVPITTPRGELLGLIQLSDKLQDEFTQHDLDLLTHLAKLLAPTLELQIVTTKLQQTKAEQADYNTSLARLNAELSESQRELSEIASHLALPVRVTRSQPYHLESFSLTDMMHCGGDIRGMSRGRTRGEFGTALVRHLYEHVLGPNGDRALALVRLFVTRRFDELDVESRGIVAAVLPNAAPETMCLTLAATAGDQADWNDVKRSLGHRAIPISTPKSVEQFPMIARLFDQLGVEVGGVLSPSSDFLIGETDAGVFYVPQARGSPYIPAQDAFVIPFDIQSVVGFGGLLPDGRLYAVILFSKVPVSRDVAELFGYLSLSTRMALLPYIGIRDKTTAQILSLDQLLRNHERIVANQEQHLHSALAALSRSNKDLEQFAYVASHDLQEPLRAVSGFCQLLEQRYGERLDEKAREFIHFAVEGAGRMQELISGLLDYSRVGTRELVSEEVDVNEVVKSALANLQIAIQQAGAVINYRQLPTVTADRLQMIRLFQNLIDNAIKYRGTSSPEIHIAAESNGGEWVFSVRDNGIGFERKYADRIFLIFQRLHVRKQYPGSGIGLSICERIVQRQGGRIWAESAPGQGSTFYFSLPHKSAQTAK